MKPISKLVFYAIIAMISTLLVGCSGKGLYSNVSGGSNSSSTSGSGSGGGAGPFTIGGTVVGLVGTGMDLQDNNGDDLTIQANGPFTFKTSVTGAYSVTVKTQPSGPTQNCTVTNASGTATTNITNIQVNCGSTGLTLGGSVSDLIGSGLTLQNNGGSNFAIAGTGNVVFTFPTAITAGTAYAVTISTQPSNPSQTCNVSNGSGTVSGNVTNIQITCSQPSFTIGGSVVGLVEGTGDTMELQDNAGDDLFVTGDTTFTFPTQVTYGGIFNVNVFNPPSSQNLPCNEFYYTGIALTNVTSVVVDCQHNDWGFQSYYVATTESSNNYAAITTPLYPFGVLAPANLGFPGGRDFAASWTDNQGRKWLFGGEGYPYPSPYAKQLPGLLNDLWVYDGTWVPANLPTFINLSGNYQVNPAPMEVVFGNGVYGTLNVASPLVNTPGARWGSSTWTDSAGNLWMFGGQGINALGGEVLLNDVWEWIPGNPPSPNPIGTAVNAGTYSGQWIWRGGTDGTTPALLNGSYGSMGVPSTLNLPGGRWAAATSVDSTGANVWLFGGQGYDATGNLGILGDLWKYNIASGQWTWVAGPNTASPNGVYGTQGMAAVNNAPGGRQAAVLWVDASGNVWLYGGFGFDSAGTGAPQGAILNDLWEFSGGEWAWVSGNHLANQTGTYGTQATSNLSTGAAGNVPGSRWGARGWTDASSNLWFFGGWGYGSTATDPTGFLDDTWEYQHSTGQWIWWKGTTGVNQASQYISALGAGLPFVKYQAGARRGAALWPPDAFGYVWVFGGEGYDFNSGNPPGYLDDLWNYLPFP
jgi:hypothetical protein